MAGAEPCCPPTLGEMWGTWGESFPVDAERLPWALVLGRWPPPTVNQMAPVPNGEEGQTLKMKVAIYFTIFIMSEAFV